MKTIRLVRLSILVCMAFAVTNVYGQDIGGIVKRKLKKKGKDKIEKTVDDGIDVIEGKDKKSDPTVSGGGNGEVVVVSTNEMGGNAPIVNFIDPGSAVFVDDFNTERPSEFPSKWTHVSGSLQNDQVLTNGEKDGVVEAISGYSTIKPTIKGDRYLGDTFKIEIHVYFYGKGNEVYYVNLKNDDNPYANHDLRIANGSLHSGSDGIVRFPGGIQPGWHVIQYSFNKGNLKGYFDGVQLINDPDITHNPEHPRKTFNRLEIEMVSPGSNAAPPRRQMISYFAIGGQGLPLYDRLINDGRLVMNDINFEVNSFVLQTSSYSILDRMVAMLTEHPELSLAIHGHTDSDGTNEFNQTLSENRANSVKSYLTRRGIEESRLTTSGYGEDQPVDNSGTDKAKAKNRRVEFVLKK
ncbi:OmpA family protein [Aureisphaera galaxeae]|uniref:OmpA family protein n=1 Tax=Aureisphaera galaxeae TaxID=1538023 RepID=UPI00234FD7FF|nr:OmpA family protein [Aureisphaera galaxeae]MDC8004925.1 OmpA family protein [Aureisphaera galaxeae]